MGAIPTSREYADAVVCRWAESRMGLPAESVCRVRTDYLYEGWLSDVTFQDESLEITVTLMDGTTKFYFVEDPAQAFSEVLTFG